MKWNVLMFKQILLARNKHNLSKTTAYPPTAGVRQRSLFWSILINCSFFNFPTTNKITQVWKTKHGHYAQSLIKEKNFCPDVENFLPKTFLLIKDLG